MYSITLTSSYTWIVIVTSSLYKVMDSTFAVIFGVCLGSLLQPSLTLSENCTRIKGQPPCVCKTSKGIIDLTPLSMKGTARFKNVVDEKNNWTYWYNPCTVFTEGDCQHAFICEQGPGEDREHMLADNGEWIFGRSDGSFAVHYSNPSDLAQVIEVSLFCEEGPDSKLIANSEKLLNHTFELHSCYACPVAARTEEISIEQ